MTQYCTEGVGYIGKDLEISQYCTEGAATLGKINPP